jgi:hypothetical protein
MWRKPMPNGGFHGDGYQDVTTYHDLMAAAKDALDTINVLREELAKRHKEQVELKEELEAYKKIVRVSKEKANG